MPRFRRLPALESDELLAESAIAMCIGDVIRPGHFFAVPTLDLEWLESADEEIYWEIFRGQVLDRTQTRHRQRFQSWSIWDRTPGLPIDEPLLSVKWDRQVRQLFVTRSVACHAWESFDDELGNIQARQATRRVRELVGAIELNQFKTKAELRDELIALLFLAVVGTSRLPLTSVEAPLPGFILGELGYCYRDDAGDAPIRDAAEWIDRSLNPGIALVERSRLLELALRNRREPSGQELGLRFLRRCRAVGGSTADFLESLQAVFNNASLSPYLGMVGTTISFLQRAVMQSELRAADEIDFLTHLLRQICRHLTAFDLIRFHHLGANYPDALLIDEVLRRLCALIEHDPALVLAKSGDDPMVNHRKRLRRRGLRAGWLLAGQYRGYRVPDVPTTPGENARVWPIAIPRLDDEQILNPTLRTRRLFEGDWIGDLAGPNVRAAFRESVTDLIEFAEQCELGTALFLDRPFGIGKHPAEPDRTLLISCTAFSRQIALQRLELIGRLSQESGDASNLDSFAERCKGTGFVRGVARSPARANQRVGVVSFDDALLAADDFVFLRTTRSSLREFLSWYDVDQLPVDGFRDLFTPGQCLILRSANEPAAVQVLDADWQLRLVIRPDVSRGYVSRAGVEHPVEGLVGDGIRLRPKLN